MSAGWAADAAVVCAGARLLFYFDEFGFILKALAFDDSLVFCCCHAAEAAPPSEPLRLPQSVSLQLTGSSFVCSSRWVDRLQDRTNRAAPTVTCRQLRWPPPSSLPSHQGRYRAGRGADPPSATSPRWIFQTTTLTGSLPLKCTRKGGESRVSRSAVQDEAFSCSFFTDAE